MQRSRTDCAQGKGGLLHSRSWRRRFFVLYRVPLGHVLVYYDAVDVSVDHVLGFIDLRTAISIVQDTDTVDGEEHRMVLRVVTPKRTFVLAPATVNQVRHCACIGRGR